MNTSSHHTSTGDQAHPHDHAKQSEHDSLLNLVPHENATHIAVNSGSWFDPNTWKNRSIPTHDARVLIPNDLTVRYDGMSDAELSTLRVDGQLDFATNRDTQMVIDTFVVAPDGTLTIGTEKNPVQGNVETRIIIADNGAINRKWDPNQLSRGVISHGTVEIHGQKKTTHLKLAQDPMAGDATLTLAEVPENWQVGDRLVLTGTHYVPSTGEKWHGTQDEELTIKAIKGNVVTLEEPLTYNHDTPRKDLKASVANYSRNVVIESENADRIPVDQRGHVMFMHSDDVDVRYVEFNELGRTDKSKPIDDFKLDQQGDRILDSNGDPIKTPLGQIKNQRGRYAVHFHRTGVGADDSQPAIAIGNAVWGSPGWGYVHHDSHLILENNTAYDVFGSAFATETGNEIGAWRNNIAIKSEGTRSTSKIGVGNQDLGHNGTGFWFQGRLVENEGNIAAGHGHSGFVYLERGVDQQGALAANLDDPAIARFAEKIRPREVPITGFKDNEVLASRGGLEVIKSHNHQGHDSRSVLDGFTAWDVQKGVHLQYTSKYTFKDFTLIAADGNHKLGDKLAPRLSPMGFDFGKNTEDMVVNGALIEGFKNGIQFEKKNRTTTLDDWHFVVIDTEFANNKTDLVNYDPKVDQIISSKGLKSGQLRVELDKDAHFEFNPKSDKQPIKLSGTKYDSVGAVPFPSGTDFYEFEARYLKKRFQQGYFVDREGTPFITIEELVSDRATGDTLTVEFIVTTTQSWLDEDAQLGQYDNIAKPGVLPVQLDRWLDSQEPASSAHGETPHSGHSPETSPPMAHPFMNPPEVTPPEMAPPEMHQPEMAHHPEETPLPTVPNQELPGNLPLPNPSTTPTNGDDTLMGTAGKDKISGLGGNDRLQGLAGNDRLNGNDGNDYLDGGNGIDSLSGRQGKDVLSGGKNNDQLDGGSGDDILMGDEGNDVVRGGKGSDIFVLQDLAGVDRIIDFEHSDKLGVSSLSDVDRLTLVQQGKDVLINSGQDTLARLVDVQASSISRSSYVEVNV